MPSTLESCGTEPFLNCEKLETLECLALFPPSLYDRLLSIDDMGAALKRTLYVPEWTLNKYKLTSGWAAFSEILPLSGIYPNDIIVNRSEVLTLPATGLPAGYKPNLFINNGDYMKDYGYNGPGSMHLKGNGTLSLNKFVMSHNIYYNHNYNDYWYGWEIYSTLYNEAAILADTVITNLSLSSGYWHFLSFPYDVKVSDIQTNGDWVIRRYDGQLRANGDYSNTWQTVSYDSVLHAGQGYIWSSSNGSFTIPAMNNNSKNQIFANTARSISIKEYPAAYASNSSWNLIGNPYPCYYDIRFMDFAAPITVWDRRNRTYVAYNPLDDSYILSPLEAFFVQCPVGVTQAGFKADGRQTTTAVRTIQSTAKAHKMLPENLRKVYNIQLSNEKMTDKTRFVINEKAAIDYEMERDAAKFMSTDVATSQIFTIENADKLAINERPLAEGKIALGLYVGTAGTYTISMDVVDGNGAILLDNVTGAETDLSANAYTFNAEQGTFLDRFTILLNNSGVTSVGNANMVDNVKITTADGVINVSAGTDTEIVLYAVSGVQKANAYGKEASFDVLPGMYVVKISGTTYKVSVNK